MANVSEEEVLDALRRIEKPGTGRNVVELEMISGIVIKASNVGFAVQVSPEEGAELEPLREACEQAVRELAGVTSVTAVLTAERSSAPDGEGSGGAPRGTPPQSGKPEIEGVGAIIAIASGKGGVGKSTLAVNLAMGLAKAGQRVGLLDADIYGPSLPRMAGISGKPGTVDGKKLQPLENYGVKVMSMGFLVEEDAPMIWRGPMVQSAIQQMLSDVAWGELDVLVVDLPPGTGDAQLTMAQRVPLTGAVIVSTPQDIALLDARKAVNMFRKVDVPIFGIVENMSYFICPHCGGRTEIFAYGGAQATAERFGVEFLGEVPLDPEIPELSDSGRPIVMSHPDSPQAAAYRSVAGAVLERLSGQEARRFPKIRYL